MIGISSFDESSGAITHVVDNIQLRVTGAGCDGVSETADTDEDGYEDLYDNCPADANPTQTDTDNDGLGDSCDP